MTFLGHLSAWVGVIALVAAAGASLAPTDWAPYRHVCVGSPTTVRRLARIGAGAMGVAITVLALAFVRADNSLWIVNRFARSDTAAWYRLAGLWGGMSGSLMLWAFFASIGAVSLGPMRRATGFVSGVAAAYGAAALILDSPFASNPEPVLNRPVGMAPILEHPAMLVHPPMVYAGLVATLVAAASTLELPEADRSARLFRRVMVAWTVLAAAMMLGGWWAYAEVGWGGFWAWDPVENVSLVPWLLLGAWVHLRRGKPAAWWLGLTGLSVLAGTAVVRGGSIGSVHAFAESPAIGWWVAATAIGLAVWWIRLQPEPVPRWPSRWFGHGRLQIIAVAALVWVALITVIGTARPLFGGANSVSPRFFAAFSVPAGMALAVGLVARAPRPYGWWASGAGAAAALGLRAMAGVAWTPLGTLGVALAGMAIGAALSRFRSAPTWADALLHVGAAVVLLGCFASVDTVSDARTLRVGRPDAIAGLPARLESVTTSETDDGLAEIRATVSIDGRRSTPSLVGYRAQRVVLAEPDQSYGLTDTTVTLRLADDDDRALIEVTRHPMVLFVWLGALLLVAAGAAFAFGVEQRADRP